MHAILGGAFILLGAVLLARLVWRGKKSELGIWVAGGLLVLGLLMTGGGDYVDELLAKLAVFVKDVLGNIRES